MSQYGVNIPKLALVTALGAILATAVILGLQAFYFWYQANLEASPRYDEPPAKLEKLLAAQEAVLADYRLLDAEKGTVQIPVDRAMREVVAELAPPAGPTEKRQEKPDER